MNTHPNRLEIKNFLVKYFSIEELKSLLFDLGLDYQIIVAPDSRIEIIAREIILYFERHRDISSLGAYLKEKRPNSKDTLDNIFGKDFILPSEEPRVFEWTPPKRILEETSPHKNIPNKTPQKILNSDNIQPLQVKSAPSQVEQVVDATSSVERDTDTTPFVQVKEATPPVEQVVDTTPSAQVTEATPSAEQVADETSPVEHITIQTSPPEPSPTEQLPSNDGNFFSHLPNKKVLGVGGLIIIAILVVVGIAIAQNISSGLSAANLTATSQAQNLISTETAFQEQGTETAQSGLEDSTPEPNQPDQGSDKPPEPESTDSEEPLVDETVAPPTLINTEPPPADTSTPTPQPDTIRLRTNTQDVDVYYGPSTENLRAAILKYQQVVQAIGKVRGSSFYEVLLDNGITGWVESDKVDFVAGSDEDVPQTWPRTSTVSNGGTGETPVVSGCSLRVWAKDNQVNDVFIRWDDLPSDTRWLYLKVQGSLNGRNTNLIEPNTIDANDVDTRENGFMLGSWRFDPDDPNSKGFPENTQFTFTLEAQDENRNGICSKSGTFTQ